MLNLMVGVDASTMGVASIRRAGRKSKGNGAGGKKKILDLTGFSQLGGLRQLVQRPRLETVRAQADTIQGED